MIIFLRDSTLQFCNPNSLMTLGRISTSKRIQFPSIIRPSLWGRHDSCRPEVRHRRRIHLNATAAPRIHDAPVPPHARTTWSYHMSHRGHEPSSKNLERIRWTFFDDGLYLQKTLHLFTF